MSASSRSRHRRKLEPITAEELANTAGMSGFCTFLTRSADIPVPILDQIAASRSSDNSITEPAPARSSGLIAAASTNVATVVEAPDVVAPKVVSVIRTSTQQAGIADPVKAMDSAAAASTVGAPTFVATELEATEV